MNDDTDKKNDKKNSEASVCAVCLTYNHEKFISETLEGFIIQKTNCPFRVIVHDDASTDATPAIMREYEEKYPGLFTMIYQNENQYSQNSGIWGIYSRIIAPLVSEKYVAFCEGDDYWNDSSKIQRQIDYMELNPDCSMCVHDTMLVDVNGKDIKRCNGGNNERDYGTGDVIPTLEGLFHTTSFLCHRDIAFNRPQEFSMKEIDDWPLAIYASIKGRVHYLGRVMSCYRVGDSASWSRRLSSYERSMKFNMDAMNAIKRMNEWTNKIYEDAFNKSIKEASSRYEFANLMLHGKFFQAAFKHPKKLLRRFAGIMLRRTGLLRR